MSAFYCEAHDRQEDADFVGYNTTAKGDVCDDAAGCVPGWTMDDEGNVYYDEELAQTMLQAQRLARAEMWAKYDKRNEKPINGPEAEKGTWGNP